MNIYVGWDKREAEAFCIAVDSLRQHASDSLLISPLGYKLLDRKRYYRPMENFEGMDTWDVISGAFMSTDHAIARFFPPYLMGYQGWALFMDADVLVRRDIAELYALRDPRYAVQVVKHQYSPRGTWKKNGSIQTAYPRKNWSSVALWNCGHPANLALDIETLNTLPGRDLHRFCWLEDSEIGSLPECWNWLVGHSSKDIDPAIVHFTEGLPDREGYENVDYAEEWRAARDAAEVSR